MSVANTIQSSALPGRAVLRLGRRHIYVALLGLFLAFITLYPLVMLVYGSLSTGAPGSEGTFNLSGYRKVFSRESLDIFANTVVIALIKTMVAATIAIALAWIVARTDTPFRGLLEVLITLPFFIPPLLTAMAWSMLGNVRTGPINQLWRYLTGSNSALIDVYSYGGVVWHMVQYSVPFMFIFMVDAFRRMNPALEEASRMCGASRWRTTQAVTLRLMVPVIATCVTLSFIRGMESLESPLFFGKPAGIRVVATEIYDSINEYYVPDYQFATSISIVVMIVMFVVVFMRRLVIGKRNYQTVSGKGYRPAVMALGPWKWVTLSFVLLFFFLSVVLPIGQLLFGSFFRYAGIYDLNTLTFRHYVSVFQNGLVWSAFKNTLLLAVSGATATMILGSIVAYIAVRTDWGGRRIIEAMAWLPWMMPGIVLGVGFLWAFALMPAPISLYGTIWALLLAYIAICIPLGMNSMSTAFYQMSVDLEECSRVSGANFFQTMTRILIALAWPSFAVGWLLCFFVVMRELSASVLLYSIGNEVLPVEMLRLWENGSAEEVCVLAMFMLVLVLAFRALQGLLSSNRIRVSG